jgi:hypothetical protein
MEKLDSELKANKARIQQFFEAKGINKLEVNLDAQEANGSVITAYISERMDIEYDSGKLAKKLSKDVMDEIVTKTYIIKDIDGLIKLVKKAGIKPQEFKQYLSVQAMVNKQEIKRLYDEGYIKMEDLQGCYTAKVTKGVRFSIRKG